MSPFNSDRPTRGQQDDVHSSADQAVVAPQRGGHTALIAAAAVLAVGVGIGGYALGAHTGETEGGSASSGATTDGPPEVNTPPLESRGGGAPGHVGGTSDAATDDVDVAPGLPEGEDSAAAYATSDGGGHWGPDVLSAGSGLSTSSPGTGEVGTYRLADGTPEEWVQMVVDGYELSGGEFYNYGPREASYEYFNDDTWASVYVWTGSTATLGYDNGEHAVDCWGWEDYDTGEITWDGTDCGTSEKPAEADALAAAEEFITVAGLDPADFDLQIVEDEYENSMHVSIEGSTGDAAQNAWFQVSESGLANASVPLPVVTDALGEYPLISPAEAVQRFHDPRFQYLYVDIPEMWDDPGLWIEYDYTPPPEVTVNPGDPLPAWVNQVTIVEAELTTGTLWAVNEAEYDVPAYILTGDNGQIYSVPALADEAFDFTQ